MAVMFAAKFTRYSPTSGERQISSEFHIHADKFDVAYTGAVLAMRAMKEASPDLDWQYDLVSIHTHDYSGTKFKGYLSIWEDPPSANEGKAA